MADLPWSEVTLFIGPDSSLRLVVDGYEMPHDLAMHFVNGSLTREHIGRIINLLETYREQMYLYGPSRSAMRPNTAPFEHDEGYGMTARLASPDPSSSTAPTMHMNRKAEMIQATPGLPGPLFIPKPEEVGLDLKRLKFYRWLYERGVINEDMDSEAHLIPLE